MTRARGMTVLELMIVIAIIGLSMLLVRSGFRLVSKADLVEDATELAAIMKRAQELAIEHGDMHRVVFDLDTQTYSVEVCQGATAIQRNEALRADPDEVKRAKDRAQAQLSNMPPDTLQVGDPEEATKRATALAGKHIADRMCVPAQDSISAGPPQTGPDGKLLSTGWVRALKAKKGIKFKEIWVQHRDESATKGQVAVYFFPAGGSEKSVIEMTDGSETFTILVFGLTGRVELRDVNDHMMRNAMGDKDARREDQQ